MAADDEKAPRLRIALGVVVLLLSHALLARSNLVLADVRTAAVASAPAPGLEGRIIALTGELESEETFSDAGIGSSKDDLELLLPAPFVVLERVIEEPVEDPDGGFGWRRVGAKGSLSGGKRLAARVTVGGLAL